MTFAISIAAFIGIAIGSVEIFQRYRSEPIAAVTNRWGFFYLLFNGAVAGFACWVLLLSLPTVPDTTLELLKYAFTAGFGGAALLRTKLLNLQNTDGKEVALGPEIVVQSFLNVIDQSLNRERGQQRIDTVRRLMDGIDFEKAKMVLPAELSQALPNVPQTEIDQMSKRIVEIDKMKGLDSQFKSILFGYLLLDLAGKELLESVLTKYGDAYRFDQQKNTVK